MTLGFGFKSYGSNLKSPIRSSFSSQLKCNPASILLDKGREAGFSSDYCHLPKRKTTGRVLCLKLAHLWKQLIVRLVKWLDRTFNQSPSNLSLWLFCHVKCIPVRSEPSLGLCPFSVLPLDSILHGENQYTRKTLMTNSHLLSFACAILVCHSRHANQQAPAVCMGNQFCVPYSGSWCKSGP